MASRKLTQLEGYTELVDKIQGDIICLYNPTVDSSNIAKLDDYSKLHSLIIVKGRVKMLAA